MTTRIVEQQFDAWQMLADYQKASDVGAQCGAIATFIGTMRDFNDDNNVSKMTLEHYPGMTERYMQQLEQQARNKWPALVDCLIVHRVGPILPAENIVLIGCWSAHRRAALDACSWLIEELKYNAPLWKKEQRADGEHWVESNTDGHGPN